MPVLSFLYRVKKVVAPKLLKSYSSRKNEPFKDLWKSWQPHALQQILVAISGQKILNNKRKPILLEYRKISGDWSMSMSAWEGYESARMLYVKEK